MRNDTMLDNALITRGLDAFRARLPGRWKLSPKRPERPVLNYRPDALLEIRAPDGSRAVLLVEAKSRLPAQLAADLGRRLTAVATEARTRGALVIAPFLTVMARERLRQAGVSYLDLAGNVRIVLERPALYIQAEGADEDPSPPRRVASCYVENPEGVVGTLDLRPAETGANVLLLEPFDEVVWERTRDEAGLIRVAVSQCAVDLLTGTGREPAEAESLLSWMAENEDAWRA